MSPPAIAPGPLREDPFAARFGLPTASTQGRCVAAIAVVCAAATCWAGSIVRDALWIGPQRFVRSNLNLPAMDVPDLRADEGTAALSYMSGFYPDTYLTLVQFDQWLNARHEPVSVDSVNSVRAIHPLCARGGDVTVVLWRSRVSSSEFWIRTYDAGGTPQSIAFRFAEAVGDPVSWAIAASDGYVLGVVDGSIAGSPRLVYVRWFDLTGQALSAPMAVADEMGGYYSGFEAALNEDGTALIASENVYGGRPDYRTVCQIARRSGLPSPPVVAAPALSGPRASEWLADGTTALCIGDATNDRILLQRRDAMSLELLEERTYDRTARRGASISRRGSVAVTALPTPQTPQLQIFDAQWLPLGGPVDFRLPLIGGSADFEWGGYHNVAIDDSGTIWIVWYAYNTPAAGYYLTSLRPIRTGDMNLDGLLNNFDIDPFVLALADPSAYEAQYGIPADVGRILGDVNGDGALNNFDIDPFVVCLVNGGCPQQQ